VFSASRELKKLRSAEPRPWTSRMQGWQPLSCVPQRRGASGCREAM